MKVIEGLLKSGKTETDLLGETDQLKAVGVLVVLAEKVKDTPVHKVADGLTIVAVGACARTIMQANDKIMTFKNRFMNHYKFTKNSNVFTLSAKSVITGCCE